MRSHFTASHFTALSIGESGRSTGLSIKALRLYDISGLLPPAAGGGDARVSGPGA